MASDQPADAARQRSATCRVLVTLSDVNDNTPVFQESLYEANIFEGAQIGSIVLQVRAQDRDSGTNGEFSYSIQSGDVINLILAVDSSDQCCMTMFYRCVHY